MGVIEDGLARCLELLGAPVMYRLRGQQAQSAMAMAGVVPEKEQAKIRPRLLRVGKTARVGGRVFDDFELALRIGVVVGGSGATVAGQDLEIDQQGIRETYGTFNCLYS